MPYNLRKRKAPAAVEEPEPVEKKPAAKKSRTAQVKSEPASNKQESKNSETTVKPKVVKRAKPPVEPKPKKEPKTKKAKAEVVPEESPPVSEDEQTEDKRVETPVKEEAPVERDEPTADQDEAPVKKEETLAEKEVSPTPKDVFNLHVFGADGCGELGLKKTGFSKKKPTPVQVSDVRQVACGPMHTIILTHQGHVLTCGCNDEGALGRETDDEEQESTPTIVKLDSIIKKVTAGDSHCVALSEDKKIYIWGNFRDEHGSIGLLPECKGEKTYKPIQVMPDKEFTDIASGSNHILLLDVKGVVYSFGVGEQGQLGRIKPAETSTIDQNQCEVVKTTAITAENREIYLRPQPVDLRNVDPQRPFICDAIYAGNYSSFATNTDKKKNRLAGWGLNNYHQLGYKGTKGQVVQHQPKRSTFTCSTSMKQVACGQHHTLFLTKSGRVYAAGRNEYGMLGAGSIKGETVCPATKICEFENNATAIAAGINTSFALTDEGKLYSWGMNGNSLGLDGEEDVKKPMEVKRLADKKVISIATGGDFSAVLVEQ